jgi:hypothetical protein
VFKVDIASVFGPDAAPVANDVLRMFCIQVAIQAMMVLAGGGDARFFSSDFFLFLLYIALGVLLYWFAVRKIVIFE